MGVKGASSRAISFPAERISFRQDHTCIIGSLPRRVYKSLTVSYMAIMQAAVPGNVVSEPDSLYVSLVARASFIHYAWLLSDL